MTDVCTSEIFRYQITNFRSSSPPVPVIFDDNDTQRCVYARRFSQSNMRVCDLHASARSITHASRTHLGSAGQFAAITKLLRPVKVTQCLRRYVHTTNHPRRISPVATQRIRRPSKGDTENSRKIAYTCSSRTCESVESRRFPRLVGNKNQIYG